MNSKQHWENIYNTKKIDGVSWYQEVPADSLKLIQKVSKNNYDKIIDIGCGPGRNMHWFLQNDFETYAIDTNENLTTAFPSMK